MSETEFLDVAIEAARVGGSILEDWSERFTVREKSRSDLVTEADHASQRAIHELISGRFPDHGFLGEEGLSSPGRDPSYRWIIDPLDGTSNYVHRFPFYAVSIALEYQGRLIAGCILDPNRDELFAALKGAGTTLNGRPVRTSETGGLAGTMAVASLPVGVRRHDAAVERFLTVLPHVQTIQRTGSAALNLSYVACGRIDAFWSTSLRPWDMAAGALIVREAGGRVSKITGDEFDVDVPDLLASNGTGIHAGLSNLLQ